jgi:steroid delta-isomerase-like uncharacterized protein
MAEENATLIRRFFLGIFQDRDLALADTLVSPDFLWHFVGQPEPFRGPDGVRQVATLYHTAFPDLQVTVDDVFAADEKVGMRWSSTGTHQGDLAGVPPTHRTMRTGGINVWRVVDGRVVEGWLAWDQLGMLQQLGVLPAPGQPAA